MSITFSNVVEQHLNTLNNTKKISDVVGEPKSFFLLRKKEYIAKRSTEGWTPDVIIGRAERTFSCSVSTLYRRFKTGEFNVLHLPMQGEENENQMVIRKNVENRHSKEIFLNVKKIMSFSKKNLDI
jgi:IS30 family transposase